MTSSTTGNQLTWVKTTLGGLFSAYWIFRLQPSGYLPIAKILTETRQAWTDTEARLNVAETYKMYAEDTLGGLSQFTGTVTATRLGTSVVIASNQDPTVNQDLSVRFPVPVKVPENSRLVAASGRYGQRLIRGSTKIGAEFDMTVFKRRSNTAAGVHGPDQWEPLLDDLREDLPYLALLLPTGQRKFVGATVETLQWLCNMEEDIPTSFPEVGNTPAVVTVT